MSLDPGALDRLAVDWRAEEFPFPGWDYPGLPRRRSPAAWFDFCGLSVSVLACLWPPEGERRWTTDHQGSELSDAPALFACFTRGLRPADHGSDMEPILGWTDDNARQFFEGRGVLQLIPERRRVLQHVVEVLRDRWEGHFINLVEEAGFSAPAIVRLLGASFPSYRDEWPSDAGVLPFNKLAQLCAAIMAAGSEVPFTDLDTFPVYPDYMLPMVLRHFGVLVYEPALAEVVDRRRLIEAGSTWEMAIRWATVYAGERLTEALHRVGNPVVGPALDYFLWHRAVLGPEAGTMGEHHRTVTLAY